MTPTLDAIPDRATGLSCGDSLRRSLDFFLGRALGQIYYRRHLEAKRNGDSLAAEYWLEQAVKCP